MGLAAAAAARSPARQEASLAAGAACAATARDPAVVGSPATSMRSLTATRRPASLLSSVQIHIDIADKYGTAG